MAHYDDACVYKIVSAAGWGWGNLRCRLRWHLGSLAGCAPGSYSQLWTLRHKEWQFRLLCLLPNRLHRIPHSQKHHDSKVSDTSMLMPLEERRSQTFISCGAKIDEGRRDPLSSSPASRKSIQNTINLEIRCINVRTDDRAGERFDCLVFLEGGVGV